MILQILLIISLIFQTIAAIIAMKLTKRMKFNVAWILFSLAILLISYQLLVEIFVVFQEKPTSYKAFSLWSTIALSLCVAVGIFYLRRSIDYIEFINKKRELTERRLLNTVIFTEEKERQRFSKDLHDGLGPLLSSAKMSMSVLTKMEKDEKTLEIINNISYVIDEAIKEVRDISNNISPAILQNFGISRALNNFVSKLNLPDNVNIKYKSGLKSKRFSGDVEVIFYRVGCELINNAIKHSQASDITVSLECWGRNLVFTIRDNGIGLPKSTIENKSQGMGLKNIISRINSLNGNIDFVPIAKGTKIIVRVKV